jgi:hypothetical protein
MKVEQEVKEFNPVVIVLETKEELQELIDVLGPATTCSELYCRLIETKK